MEPGRDDREDMPRGELHVQLYVPLWSPVAMTGKTPAVVGGVEQRHRFAAMEPGRDDREDRCGNRRPTPLRGAAMEPGRDDREDPPPAGRRCARGHAAMEPGRDDREDLGHEDQMNMERRPLWSPVAMTGKTR